MNKFIFAISVFFLFTSFASSETDPVPHQIFDRAWKVAKSEIYPKELSKRFTEEVYKDLKAQIDNPTFAPEAAEIKVARILNPFLRSLNISHTGFLTEDDLDFWVLKSLFQTRKTNLPNLMNLGAQFRETPKGWWVRAVPERSPAEKAGLKRGDVILTHQGQPFHPVRSFRGMKKAKSGILTWNRAGKEMSAQVTPTSDNPHHIMLEATKRSEKIISFGGRRVGYLHLWSGTNPGFLKALVSTVERFQTRTDAMILDLRDGYGGAWLDYLDPFFDSRSKMFVSKVLLRDGREEILAQGQRTRISVYKKPLVVLINEGVRSGKESLAFQFRKSKRAFVIGTTTAGAFVAGRGFFSEERLPYLLFLSTSGMALDGEILEGVGVAPDLRIAYEAPSEEDPQLKAALEHTLKYP
ncbi:MAG: hypothetical protein K2X47_06210 [Bdellovibrionales bacterium]|nr:hypothetical protein [Bdellovibrionales bacterium]